jgi:DNA-binding CsgD family transcriptional regulator
MWYPASMAVLSLYLSIITILLTTSATTMCLAAYGAFRHRAAFWLSMCMIGLAFFALTILLSLIEGIGNGTISPGAGPHTGPRSFVLLWQAMGSIIVAHSLPRFLLAAFGGAHRKLTYRLLDAVSAIIVVLSIIRVATGWNDTATIAAAPNGVLRVVLFALVGGALTLTLVFQSRLPDRSLFKAVVVQAGALILLFPFVVLEDLGQFAPRGFPQLAGQVLILTTSIFAILHAKRSLMRPKYVADKAPSVFFAEHFGISRRELEIVAGVLEGLSNIDIAERLFISPRTVEKHLYNIYQKAGIKNRLQLYNLLQSDAL